MTVKPLFFLMAWAICAPMLSSAGEEPRAGEYGFIENKGQFYDQQYQPNPAVKYLLKTAGLNVQLRNNGFSYDAYVMDQPPVSAAQMTHMSEKWPDATIRFHRVDVTLEGANTNARLVTGERGADHLNYFNAMGAFDEVHHFGKVTYQNIYNGIDLEFVTDKAHGVKYNFIVHPGADMSQIKMKYAGANSIWLKDGHINMSLAHGAMQEEIPASFTASTHEAVAVQYRAVSNNVFSYEAGSYDKTQTLIIDPNPDLAWGTYYGGSGNEYSRQVAVNGSSVYIGGYTTSTGAIATTGSYQAILAGNNDGFVAKFNTSGVRQWATYYGGTGDDFIAGISVSSNGEVCAMGQTTTTGAGIATLGAHQGTHGGGSNANDGFVAKFNALGTLSWGTFYGGTGIEYLMGSAFDGTGNIYVTGTTGSTTGVVPGTGFQNTYAGGNADGILIKFNNNGVRQWATYTGTDSIDEGDAVVVDGNGNVFMCGTTYKPTAGYITSVGAHQTTYGGGAHDYFVGKFDAATGGRYWGTLYGGSGDETAWPGRRLAVDPSGNVILVGGTTSTNAIATSGAFQTSISSSYQEGMIVKFNTNGVRQWGTYFGTSDAEVLAGVVTDASGDIYIAGVTTGSTGLGNTTSFQPYGNGLQDGFYGKFAGAGNSLIYSTYYGDFDNEYIFGVDIDANRHIYATGTSSTFGGGSMSTNGAHQPNYGGGDIDGFLGRINACETGPISVTTNLTQVSCSNKSDGVVTLNASGGTAPYLYRKSTGGFGTNNTFTGLPAGSHVFFVVDDNSCEIFNQPLIVNLAQPPVIQKPSLSGPLNTEKGNLETYSTPAQAGVTFNWILTGGTVQSGQGTNSVIVQWTTSGMQNIKVVAGSAGCGDSATSPINVKPPVSVDDVVREDGIAMYPNPARELVHISLDRTPAADEMISVFNTVGRVVLQQPLRKEQDVNISQLAGGMYNVNIGGWRGKFTKL